MLGWVFHAGLIAQPTVSISSATINAGDQVCLDVTVADFTDILSMQFTIAWDSTVLQFDRVDNLNLERLTNDNFDLSMVESGVLLFDWTFNECQPELPGLTILEDGTAIFSVCFTAIGGYGATTPVSIVNAPLDIRVTRVNACPNNIGLFEQNGLVSTDVRPFRVVASEVTGNEGDLVCVSFKVQGFDQLTSFQFSVNWDSSILRYNNVIPSENLVNLNRSGFGTPDGSNVGAGSATVSWSFVQPDNSGITLADDTEIFQLCFDIVGDCETSSAIQFSNTPTQIEVTNTVEAGFNITFVGDDGKVQVGDCDPTGLPLIANCPPPANVNDEVCVEVTTADFQNVTDLEYLMEWNPNILQFKDIRNRTNALFGFNDAFDVSNTVNGVLGVEWEAPTGLDGDLGDGDKLYDVCFDVVGLGGDSPIRFANDPARVRVNNGPNIGINPTNCVIEVNQPAEATIIIDDAPPSRPGDTICIGFSAFNFNEVLEAQFSLAFEPNHMRFISVDGINAVVNFPGADESNFNFDGADLGSITFSYEGVDPITIPDGDVIFLMCFEITGEPQTCDQIEFQDLPLENEVITANSNGNNIGLFGQAGEVCVLEPDGFDLVIGDRNGTFGDTTCVPISVADFTDITAATFAVSWDPTSLRFAGVDAKEALTLTDDNFITASTDVGVLTFDWEDLTGQTLTDTTNIFDVCFELTGAPEECYPVSVNPDPVVSTLQGRGDLKTVEDGEVCIRDTIIIESVTINPVTCPDKEDGSIIVRARKASGAEDIFFDWKTDPNQRDSIAQFLGIGEVEVTIFDLSSDPIIEIDTSFTVDITTDLPFADAGTDKVLGCDPNIVILSGSGNTEPNYSFQWSTSNGSLPGQRDENVAAAGAAGTYVLTVTNDDTRCAARDTVMVTDAPRPQALAGPDQTFTCINDTITLDGSATAQADSISYSWRVMDGSDGMIVEEEDTLRSPRVAAPGMYIMSAINNNTACFTTDTVEVIDGRFTPNVEAGEDMELLCDQNTVMLDGTGSVNERQVSYQWSNRAGEILGNNVTFNAPALGTYFLTVIDQESGCTNIDSVVVFPTDDFPVVTIAGQTETVITCDRDTVILIGSFQGEDKMFEWSALNGGNIVASTANSITPRVTEPGTYQLSVTDTETSCTTVDSIVVTEDRVAPDAEAGEGFILTCTDTSFTLDGTGSSEGANIDYTWTLNMDTVSTGDLQTTITREGIYVLEVKNTDNGCTATDNVEIGISGDRPQIEFADPIDLTCTRTEVDLSAVVTPAAEAYTVTWVAVNGNGQIPVTNPDDSLMVSVGQPGEYRLRVENTATGCSAQNEIMVVLDTVAPTANAGTNQLLNCVNNSVVLDGSASSDGEEFTYEWTAVEGGETPATPTSSQLTVATVGRYQIEVTNNINGCTSTDRVEVLIDTLTPEALIEEARTLTCQDTVVSLNATQSIAQRSVATWLGLGGQSVNATNNQLVVDVTQPGLYTVLLTDTISGCTARDTVEVLQTTEPPTADAGSDVTLLCIGQAVSLDGSASSQGDNFQYQWTAVDGGTILNATSLMPSVDEPGTYQLEVTNITTGCNETATVNARLSDVLVDAEAGDDIVTCETEELLFANAPEGTFGMWSSQSSSFIETPDMPSTAVTGLQEGDNVFTWTLSTDECPEYSSSEVIVRRSAAPEAVNDLITLPLGETQISVDLTANDILNNVDGFNITLLGAPQLGNIDTLRNNSVLDYSVKAGLFGESEFEYLICSEQCPNLCDTGLVLITVPVDPDFESPEEPNTITPNGDGANDRLVFEILEGVFDFYPDNELIIFNRWGDIVYQAKPYLNNWDGTTDTGQMLPDGTYYYILRLDISNGVILRGDMTIVR